MAFNSTATIEQAVVDQLKVSAADLATYWDTIIPRAQTRAYNLILQKLLGRGYSLAQILAWDQGAEFELDISLWWCWVDGAGQISADDKYIKNFDRRLELDTVLVMDDGAIVTPAGTKSQVGFGYNDDSRSTFERSVDGDGSVTETQW